MNFEGRPLSVHNFANELRGETQAPPPSFERHQRRWGRALPAALQPLALLPAADQSDHARWLLSAAVLTRPLLEEVVLLAARALLLGIKQLGVANDVDSPSW